MSSLISKNSRSRPNYNTVYPFQHEVTISTSKELTDIRPYLSQLEVCDIRIKYLNFGYSVRLFGRCVNSPIDVNLVARFIVTWPPTETNNSLPLLTHLLAAITKETRNATYKEG